jgi:hypothetical protein
MSTTQFFLWNMNLKKQKNLKLILLAFEISGLKINFHKSELFCFGETQNEVNSYAFVWLWVGQVSYEVFWYSNSLSETCNLLN